jgi:hypothetical protein
LEKNWEGCFSSISFITTKLNIILIDALGLAFEHSGWQSEQSWTFAEIFSDAIRHGLPAIQTQHPGLYYQQVSLG